MPKCNPPPQNDVKGAEWDAVTFKVDVCSHSLKFESVLKTFGFFLLKFFLGSRFLSVFKQPERPERSFRVFFLLLI